MSDVDRVVGVVMRCLGEVQSEMSEQCSSSSNVVAQYEQYLISPLVRLTRSFVLAKCAMSDQSKQFFAVADDDVTYRTASVVVTCCALVALAVARRLVLSDLY